MLSREDFYMIKQMRKQGAYIIDIATQEGCSERTVRRYLKYSEPPARKTRHKMAKLKPFMDYTRVKLISKRMAAGLIFTGPSTAGGAPLIFIFPCVVTAKQHTGFWVKYSTT